MTIFPAISGSPRQIKPMNHTDIKYSIILTGNITALHTNGTANISVVTGLPIHFLSKSTGKLWLKFKSNSCERTRYDDRGGTDAPCRRAGVCSRDNELYHPWDRVIFIVLVVGCASCKSVWERRTLLSIVRVRDMLRFLRKALFHKTLHTFLFRLKI